MKEVSDMLYYMVDDKKTSANKGFTLVEMIIIILIIAILIAIAIPVTLNIISSSSKGEYAIDAKSIWTATQTVLNEQLANDKHYVSSSSGGVGTLMDEKEMDNDYKKIVARFSGKVFFDFTGYELSTRVLKKIDNADSMKFIYFLCGRFYDYYYDENKTDMAYKVYLVAFGYKDDDKTYFYDGKEIRTEMGLSNPDSISKLTDSSDLKMKVSGKEIKVQFYCIKKLNKNGQNDTSSAYTYFKDNVIES